MRTDSALLNSLARHLRQAERVTLAGIPVGVVARVPQLGGWWARLEHAAGGTASGVAGGALVEAEGIGFTRWQARNALKAAALAIDRGAARAGEAYDLTREGLQLVEPGHAPYRLADTIGRRFALPAAAAEPQLGGLFAFDNRQGRLI